MLTIFLFRRNGYLLPPPTDDFCSAEYLNGVRTGGNWLPRNGDCKLYGCLDPPSRAVCATVLYHVMYDFVVTSDFGDVKRQAYYNTADRVRDHPPNRQFTLTLLGNFKPNHEYFEKDFTKAKKAGLDDAYEIDNSDGFFTGLPPCKPSKKNSMQLGMSKYFFP